jgi:hypothetical protein
MDSGTATALLLLLDTFQMPTPLPAYVSLVSDPQLGPRQSALRPPNGNVGMGGLLEEW